VSKVATGEAKNGAGEWYVERGTEKPFLAPMPIERIPGVGDKTAHLLRSMGVAKIHTLQELHVDLMHRLLGEHGPVLWRKANGIDDSPVVAWHERKSISTERTFERDTIDVVKLKGMLTAMAESLAFQLRKGEQAHQLHGGEDPLRRFQHAHQTDCASATRPATTSYYRRYTTCSARCTIAASGSA
jgi:DNA polymerase-4